MTNFPFGFGQGDAEGRDPNDPAAQFNLFTELQKLLNWTGGPVNWDLAKQLATQTLGDSSRIVSPADRLAVAEAIRLADLWLDDVTDLPSGVQNVESWSRAEWLDRTLPVWAALCDPVAGRVVEAMGKAIPAEQLQAFGAGNPLAGIMNQVGGLMFGAQVGQGLGGLAHEVLSATDVGIPLGPNGVAALVPENVAAFGEGLERPEQEIRLYLALREAAHQRLFGHVPWLRQRLLDTVESYARGITIDMSAIETAVQGVDPMNPESVQEALAGGLFAPQQTPEQEVALRRLETLLALVEGWVDSVVTAAAADRMPGAEALREAMRRRRATGGPAEQTFATLVGLELRPRRLREAAALWWAVTEKRGVSGRDAIWSHPDLLPTADDLDDPLGFGDAETKIPDDISELDAPSATPPAGDRPAADTPATDTPAAAAGAHAAADTPADADAAAARDSTAADTEAAADTRADADAAADPTDPESGPSDPEPGPSDPDPGPTDPEPGPTGRPGTSAD